MRLCGVQPHRAPILRLKVRSVRVMLCPAAANTSFAVYLRVVLGRNGIEAVLPFGPLSTFERAAMAKMLPELKASIEKGVQFAHK